MSAVSSRNEANVIESVAIPVGAIAVGACLFGLAKGLSALAKIALKESRDNSLSESPQYLKSVAELRAESASLKLSDFGNSNLESLKAEAFKQLATQPFLVANPAELKTSVMTLDGAKTLDELKTAHQKVVTALIGGHQQVFTTALVQASQRASLKIGFTKIESLPSPLGSTVRFAATDSKGRTLVTEINAVKDGNMRVETEVVGVSDGSCNSILNDFDNALENEGVKSKTPQRKFTGGVFELAAVREFLKGKIAPTTKNAPKTKPITSNDDGIKRTRQLNQKSSLSNRRR